MNKEKEAVWAKFAYTASDGKVYNVDYYNLDVIIYYRVVYWGRGDFYLKKKKMK